MFVVTVCISSFSHVSTSTISIPHKYLESNFPSIDRLTSTCMCRWRTATAAAAAAAAPEPQNTQTGKYAISRDRGERSSARR